MVILIISLILSLTSCSSSIKNPSSQFSLTSWNVQNLMDDKLDGSEYEEYTPKEGWDKISYHRRLKITSDVIDDLSSSVVILQEIENSEVLKDLLDTHLERKGYKYFGSIKNENEAIAIGFLSKIKPSEIKTHSVIGSRSILELDFNIKGEDLVILACHAKSRIQGVKETENQRIEMTKTLNRLIEKNKNKHVLCCGDFNEDVRESDFEQKAFVDVNNSYYPTYHRRGSLGVSGNKRGLYEDVLYCPYLDKNNHLSKKGTYFYQGEWYNFDQILFNEKFFDDSGLEYYSYQIYSPLKILTTSNIPNKWDLKRLNGVSDHLPVEMKLNFIEKRE